MHERNSDEVEVGTQSTDVGEKSSGTTAFVVKDGANYRTGLQSRYIRADRIERLMEFLDVKGRSRASVSNFEVKSRRSSTTGCLAKWTELAEDVVDMKMSTMENGRKEESNGRIAEV